MEIDWQAVRARFSGMSREELLEEAALHADEYAPLARQLLEGEALARGIDPSQVAARRRAAAADGEAAEIDLPALLTSSDEKHQVLELVNTLRDRGIAAIVRELDPQSFHRSGHSVGRWGLMVSGPRAREAASVLEAVIPPTGQESAAAPCRGCGSCGGEDGPAGDDWPEDGDWWKQTSAD